MSSTNSISRLPSSEVVATARNVGDPAIPPCAEFCAPRLAPTYEGEPVAKLRNERNPALEFAAESRKWLPALAAALWKPKPSIAIHDLIGGDLVAKLRTVYCWCAGENEPFGFILIKLLHSNQGWRVLEFLMRGCTQPWWVELQQGRVKAELLDELLKKAKERGFGAV